MLSRVIFLITNTSLPKIGKRLLIGPQSTNGSGCSFQQTFVGKETSDEPLRKSAGRLSADETCKRKLTIVLHVSAAFTLAET